MNALIEAFANRPRPVITFMLLLLIAGAISYAEIPKEAEPDITIPMMTAFGTRGAAHHQEGMARMAEMIASAELVCLEGVAHDAPTSHPADFCHQLVEPLLRAVGAPWSDRLHHP